MAVREIPNDVINHTAPTGTPLAAAAHPGDFYCNHAVKWEWQGDRGGYLPMVLEADEMHPADIPIPGQGALPGMCQPATGFNPADYPNAGPGALERARLEVMREHHRR
jgi:hypothetical protein